MNNHIRKTNNLVCDLHAYHDGTLPLVEQEFHRPAVEILRCGHWLISVWNHSNLSAPYWRLYWNQDDGAVVRLDDADFRLGPGHLVLIAPSTPFRTFLGEGEREGEGAAPDGDGGEENVMVGCPYDAGIAAALGTVDTSAMVRHFFVHFAAGAPYDAIGARIFRFALAPSEQGALRGLAGSLSRDAHRFDHRQSLALLALVHSALARIGEEAWPRTVGDWRVRRILEFIDKHFQEPLTNATFAHLAGMAPNAAVRVFREKTGSTPLEHLKRRRVERASILLHHTDRTVDQVAEECGFCNRHYFSKVFADAYGVGPATYRRTRLA